MDTHDILYKFCTYCTNILQLTSYISSLKNNQAIDETVLPSKILVNLSKYIDIFVIKIWVTQWIKNRHTIKK